MRRSLRPLAIGVALAACAKQTADPTFLQADDLVAPKDIPFDKNAIIDLATLSDWQTLSVDDVQRFLHQTPYKRPSFLDTYQSNGVRAADAIVKAATTHRVNALALLALAQADQGLIGEQLYPAPPARAEYAFGCGCPGQGACAPQLAGFDCQVDCLAGQLRQSLDELEQRGTTAGGWAKDKPTKTFDGELISPVDGGTCAVYQYAPYVNEGKPGGAWLFWSLFQKFAQKLDYVGPIGGGSGSAWIGDACRGDSDCAVDGAVCQTAYPGGLCTRDCTRTRCPDSPGRPPSFCATVEQTGSCLAVCDPNVAGSCRGGYECRSLDAFGTSGSKQFVCVPVGG